MRSLAVPAIEFSYPPVPDLLGISPHGILAAVGILTGFTLLRRAAQARDLNVQALESGVLWGVIAGVVGARVDYVISHYAQFGSFGQAIDIRQGGLALFGGLIAGVLTAVFLLRAAEAPVVPFLDSAGPFILLAIAVGRVGDLLLTDHLGAPTTSAYALGYVVRPGYHLAPGFGTTSATPPGPGESCGDPGKYFAGCAYHLTPAYDMLGALALAALLLWLSGRSLRRGVPFALFVVLYAVQRLLLDFTRGIDERPVWGLTGTQLLSLVLIALSAVVLGVLWRHPLPAPPQGAQPPGAATAE
jgi:phosphatidylglycerol:prolipoprotein diacylglycerol transferase